jgi:hypothetical protein
VQIKLLAIRVEITESIQFFLVQPQTAVAVVVLLRVYQVTQAVQAAAAVVVPQPRVAVLVELVTKTITAATHLLTEIIQQAVAAVQPQQVQMAVALVVMVVMVRRVL